MRGYVRLGDCPAEFGNWPSSVKAGARNRRKATVKILLLIRVATKGTIPEVFFSHLDIALLKSMTGVLYKSI